MFLNKIKEKKELTIIIAIYLMAFLLFSYIICINIFKEKRIIEKINGAELQNKIIVVHPEKTLSKIKIKISSPQKNSLENIKIFTERIKINKNQNIRLDTKNFQEKPVNLHAFLYDKSNLECKNKEYENENELECILNIRLLDKIKIQDPYLISMENNKNIENQKIRLSKYYIETNINSLFNNLKRLIWNKK